MKDRAGLRSSPSGEVKGVRSRLSALLPCPHLLMANLVPIVLRSMGRKALRRAVNKTSYHAAFETIGAECISQGSGYGHSRYKGCIT